MSAPGLRAGLPRGEAPRDAWLGQVIWPKLILGRRASVGWKITRVVFCLVGVGIALGIYQGSLWFLQLCYAVEAIGPLLCRKLLDLVLLALLSVLLLSNIITGLSSFFLARDLELLVASPLAARTLFAARFWGQLATSSWMVLSFGVPTLLAFASVAGTELSYPAILVTLPPMLVFPAAAGTVITLLLVRFMPAARARDIVAGLMFVAFLVLYLLLRLAQPERFVNPEGFSSLIYLLSSLSAPSGTYLPSHWATEVLARTFRASPPTDGWRLMLAALWTGAGASFVLASLVFRGTFGAAYSRSQDGKTVARLSRMLARLRGTPLPPAGEGLGSSGRPAPQGDVIRGLTGLVPRGPLREFVVKDTKLLLRDAAQWSQLVLLLALAFVYLYNFRHFRQLGEAGLVGPFAMYIIGIGLCSFVTAAVSVRFAFPLISLEGRMLWLIRTSPMAPAQLLRAKLATTFPPLLLLAEGMSVISSLILQVELDLLLLGAAVALLTTSANAALAIGLGAMLPDYQADSAAKVAASFGGLICMILAILISLVLAGLVFYPAFVIHRGLTPRAWPLAWSLAGLLLITGAAIYLPLRLGARALARLER